MIDLLMLSIQTRIFVTNQVQYLKHTDDIIILDKGAIKAHGPYEELLLEESSFAEFMRTHHQDDTDEGMDHFHSTYYVIAVVNHKFGMGLNDLMMTSL